MQNLRDLSSQKTILIEDDCYMIKTYSYDEETIWIEFGIGDRYMGERVFNNTVAGNEEMENFIENFGTAKYIRNYFTGGDRYGWN